MSEQEEKSAMNKALYYLGFRARSSAQMRKYLEKKEFSPPVIDAVIERLKGYGYLDDAQLAERIVEITTQSKAAGSRIAKQKLYQAGIDSQDAQMAIDSIDSETERQNAHMWAMKIYPKLKDEDPRKRKEKMFRRLIGKGFSYDLVKETIQSFDWEAEQTDT